MGSMQVNGVEVVIKAPTDGQIAAIGRYAQILRNDSIAAPQKMEAYLRVSAIVTKLVSDGDRQLVDDALEEGTLTLQGMIEAALRDDTTEPAPAPIRRGRGRPRKSA